MVEYNRIQGSETPNASEYMPYHRNRGVYRKETIIKCSNKYGSRQAEARRSSKEGAIARCSAVRDEENRGRQLCCQGSDSMGVTGHPLKGNNKRVDFAHRS